MMYVSMAVIDNLYYFWTGQFEVLFRSSDSKRRNGFKAIVVCMSSENEARRRKRNSDEDSDFVS